MLKPVHALVGSDVFLQLEALAGITAELPRGTQRIDVDGETAELGNVLDEVRSFAMFSESKLIVIRSADEFVSRFREKMEDYVAKPAADSVVILRMNSLPKNQRIYKLIDKHGQIHPCEPPAQKDLPAWIVKRAKDAHDLAVPLDAARVLADLIGNDLGRLDNEIEKVALQADGKVDAATIARSVSFQREQEMWDMTDEVAAGHTASAVTRWRKLVQMDSSTEFRAVTWLTIWLEKVRKYYTLKRQGLNEAAILKELKIWPFDKQRPFVENALKLGEKRTGQLVELLADIDRRSKSGLGEMVQNVERFILAAGQPTARGTR
jgi:DNA polymerase III delta subunit